MSSNNDFSRIITNLMDINAKNINTKNINMENIDNDKICLICQSDKQLPTSYLEKLCCSSSIKNEPLITLNCCSKHFHKSCLDTYIITRRDAEETKPPNLNVTDICPHCNSKILYDISLTIPWNSIHEHNEYLTVKKYSNLFSTYVDVSVFLLILFIIISPSIYSSHIAPKYVSLCANSNLTITSNSTFALNMTYLCDQCINNGASFLDDKSIVCPHFITFFQMYSPYLITACTCVIIYIFARLVQWGPMYSDFNTKNILKNKIKCYLPFICVVILCIIRVINLIIYFQIYLDPVDHIDNFTEIYDLQLKYTLMDVFVGLIPYSPVVLGFIACCLYLVCGLVVILFVGFYKIIETLYYCIFHRSHTFTQNDAYQLSPTERTTLKKN